MIATATCPKCEYTNELLACENDGTIDFRLGQLADGSQGLICKACNLGWSHTYCQGGCGAAIPATAFGTPTSRIARSALEGMEGYQGGSPQSGNCFIATEIYGSDSVEVNVLRQFRDNALITNRIGNFLVSIYYRFAPSIIPIMRRSGFVRFTLCTFVGWSVFFVQRMSIGSNPSAGSRTNSALRRQS